MGIRPSMQKVMRRHLKLAGAVVCELGDQFCGSKSGRVLARDWYEAQGAQRYVSLDANGLNGALVMDLNQRMHANADLADIVTDFGTGEHVWNQDEVWRTLHTLCKPGGHIVFDRPTQGYGDHCFSLINRSVIAGFCHFNRYRPIWIGRAQTTRGELLRGILRKPSEAAKFVTPQQGRYFKHIRPIMTDKDMARGADYKSSDLLTHKLVGKQLPALADETGDKGIWGEDGDGDNDSADGDSGAGAGVGLRAGD